MGKIVKYPKKLSGFVLLVVLIFNQSFAETKIIRANRMIYVTTGELVSPAVIVVENKRIVAVDNSSISPIFESGGPSQADS